MLSIVHFYLLLSDGLKKTKCFPQEVEKPNAYGGVSITQRKTTLEEHHLLNSMFFLPPSYW